MPKALLSTKLYAPAARPNAVRRPRLVEKLLAGLYQPGSFSLLSGPAGFGKTTLLSQLVSQAQQPAAWVSLDDGDNDPVRFWTYFTAACQTVQAGLGAAAQSMLQSSQPLPIETVPILLINEFDNLDCELVLILDDYHTLQNEMIQAALAFLLEHLPGNLHLVVSTRVDPPWPLARFRARNQLVEIRAQDLRFTTEEAAAFLRQTTGLELTVEEVAALERRTEGWIAGLQLAALSMQGRRDLAGFVKAFTGSHLYVAEYLMEEVLQRQPVKMQSFLLRTSILERMNGELCEAVTGRQDGQEILAALHRANLFINALDDEGRWFRYHHLFADLLQARLRQELPVDKITALHQRAAEWYEQNGFVSEAANHALAARDFDGLSRLIEQNANQMLAHGELETLRRWTDALPPDVIGHHPQILIAKGWALTLEGAVRQVGPLLEQAEAQAKEGYETPTGGELAGFAAAIRAFLAMMAGEDAQALALAERAEALLPESSVHARWLLPYTMGAAYRGQGQYEKAVEAFEQQARMGEAHDNLIVWATGVTGAAIVRRVQGRLRETGEICRQALQRVAEMGAAQSGSLAKLETPLIEALREQNELEEAEQRLADVMGRMRTWPMPTDRLHASLAQIEVQEARGDLTGAFETLRAAKDLIARQPVLINLKRSVALAEIRLLLKSGNLATAERLMEALQPGTSRWVELREQEFILLARLRLAQGRPDEAERILAPLIIEAEAGERPGVLIESLSLSALAGYEQGNLEPALRVLKKALSLAEPEGYVRVFVDEGDRMRAMLAAVRRQQGKAPPSKAYLAKLLEAFGDQTAPAPGSLIQGEVDGLVEPLTARELEVLQLLAAGGSNRAIAEKLVITVSAVKKHCANLYGKLGVNSRTQAVARARQLEILPMN